MTRGSSFGIEAEFFGTSRHDAARAVQRRGVQCMVEGYGHEKVPWWKIVSDSSVHDEDNGNELVSPVLSLGRPAFGVTHTALKALRDVGARVDASCGLHIHHNAPGLTWADVLNVARHYTIFQKAILGCLPLSRRHTVYCKPADESWLTWIEGTAIRGGNVRNRLSRSDRYQAVNFAALGVHNTVEFRQHSGTLRATKATHWAALTNAILRTPKLASDLYATRNPADAVALAANINIGDVVKYLQLPKEDLDYWELRRKLFNPPMGNHPEGGDAEDKDANEYDHGNNEYDEYDEDSYDDEGEEWQDCESCGRLETWHANCGRCHAEIPNPCPSTMPRQRSV